MASRLHSDLRGDSFRLQNGPFQICNEIRFNKRIIDSVAQHPPRTLPHTHFQPHDEVAFYLKPLAFAHTSLAVLLGKMPGHLVHTPGPEGSSKFMIGGEDWVAFMVSEALLLGTKDRRCLYAVMANQYRLAAESQLLDAEDGAILWWGYAANMTKTSGYRGNWEPEDGADAIGYTLGDLRYAIKRAQTATLARDTLLWGEDDRAGGSYEGQALIVAGWLEDKDDDWELPHVLMETSDSSGRTQLLIEQPEGDVVICEDFEAYITRDQAQDVPQERKQKKAEMQSKLLELEGEHGPAAIPEVVPLSMLCLRELHRQGHECAHGEADPAEVVLKLVNGN
jgi:hypothetical protein